MRKPFHLKTKLLYQTKINLWGWDEDSLKQKLKKKKWNFLKSKGWKNSSLDTFRFSPFANSFSRRRINTNFKDNLYLRKLVRLKYARLKNKEFYNIFKKNKGYKKLIKNLGKRLDVNLFNILFPLSIFSLRQNILHGKVLLNGRKINSPNIELKLFDVISLKFSDFSNLNFLYQNIKEQAAYFSYIGSYLFYFSNFENLDKDSQKKFISDISEYLAPDDKEIVENFFTEEFASLFLQDNKFHLNNKEKLLNDNIFSFDLEGLIRILNKKYIKNKIIKFSQERINKLSLTNVDSMSNAENIELGFFNNKFNHNNFEIQINGDYLDIVFLGFSEEDIIIKNNEKFLLHYLY